MDSGRKGGSKSGKGKVGPPTAKSLQAHNEKPKRELADIAHIGEKDLEAVGKLYSSIIRLYKDLTEDQLSSLTAQFDNHIQYVMESLNERLQGINDHFLRCGEFVLAKHAFHDVCIAEILKHIKYQLKNPVLEDILSRVFRCHQELMAQFPRVVSNMHAHYREEIASLRAQLTSSEKETYSVLEAAEILEKQKRDEAGENKRLEEELAAIKKEKESLLRRIQEEERKRNALQEQVAKGERQETQAGPGPRPARSAQKRTPHHQPAGAAPSSRRDNLASSAIDFGAPPRSTASPSKNERKRPTHSANNPGPRRRNRGKKDGKFVPVTERESFLRLTAPRKTPAEKAAEKAALAAEEAARLQEEKKQDDGGEFSRKLTLNQLRAVIEEIYVSKQKFDLKCDEAQLPYETMEQHVYTFLNQKYGLRSIILGWLKAIRAGVMEYKDQDPDVQCFGKILSNDLHEGYLIDYHYNLKKKINQLLYTIIQIKNPKVTGGPALAALFEERIQGAVWEDEWRYMVRDLYPQTHDQEALIAKISDFLAAKGAREQEERERMGEAADDAVPRSIRQQMRETAPEGPELLYKEFVHQVLEYQLSGHVTFLKKFKHWFNLIWKKSADPNKVPGIINEADFTELVKNLHPGQSDELIIDMLDTIDPFETSKITFSQCASILMPILVHIASEEDHLAYQAAVNAQEEDDDEYYDDYGQGYDGPDEGAYNAFDDDEVH